MDMWSETVFEHYQATPVIQKYLKPKEQEDEEIKNDEDENIINENEIVKTTDILFTACTNKDSKTVEFILENYNVDINKLKNGESLLHIAINNSDITTIYLLLNHNADPHILNKENKSAFYLAESTYFDCIDKKTDEVKTKLFWRIVQILKKTSILNASKAGDLDRVKFLIEDEGIKPNTQNMYFFYNNYIDMV